MVVGCQLHQQSAKAVVWPEPRVTWRDQQRTQGEVASLVLGLFLRVASVCQPHSVASGEICQHFYLQTVTGWFCVSQGRYCSFWPWEMLSKTKGNGWQAPLRKRSLCRENEGETKEKKLHWEDSQGRKEDRTQTLTHRLAVVCTVQPPKAQQETHKDICFSYGSDWQFNLSKDHCQQKGFGTMLANQQMQMAGLNPSAQQKGPPHTPGWYASPKVPVLLLQ